jgi:hypothetical protein
VNFTEQDTGSTAGVVLINDDEEKTGPKAILLGSSL